MKYKEKLQFHIRNPEKIFIFACCCVSANFLSPHTTHCRWQQYPLIPLVSPHALLWKAVPRGAIKETALYRAPSRPLSHTVGAHAQSHCARQTRRDFLSLCWFIQRMRPTGSLSLPLVPYGAASVGYWPRKEATARKRSCRVSTLTKAPPIAPSVVSPTVSSTTSSRTLPLARRAGWGLAGGSTWQGMAGEHSCRSTCPEPTKSSGRGSTKLLCTGLRHCAV